MGDDGLGIPLFHQNRIQLIRSPDGEVTQERVIPPIYQQWTLLSYFLQMCSPICLSPIEGGHRTLQLIKFFTGAKFTSDSPQPMEPPNRRPTDRELKPNKSINLQGVGMTSKLESTSAKSRTGVSTANRWEELPFSALLHHPFAYK